MNSTNGRKYLTVVIAAAMLSSFCTVTAFADQTETPAAAENTATVDTPDKADEDKLTSTNSPLVSAPAEQKRKRMGDIDSDDFITASDALAALRASIFRDNIKPMDKQLSDINGDGVCTSSDALTILRCSIGINKELLDKPENTDIEWLKDKDGHIFGRLKDGKPASGLVRVDDYICGFDENGRLLTGKQTVNAKAYTFTDNGVLVEGWQNEKDGLKYYSAGAAQNGWITVFDQQFYLKDNAAVTGWQNMDGKKMYFNEYGLVSMGFIKIDGKTYYFDDRYNNKTGWLDLYGDLYYLYENGGMATGLEKINDKLYYFLDDGKAASGWQLINESRYYISDDHTAVTGKTTINGDSYEFDSSGVMITGWLDPETHTQYIVNGANAAGVTEIDGSKYFFDVLGSIIRSTRIIDDQGYHYYVDENGKCAVGKVVIDGDTYIYGDDGILVTGWLSLDGHNRYLDNGKVATGLKEIDGTKYFFDENGNRCEGFYTDSTGTHFINAQGVNQTGWFDYDGARYYFDQNGNAAKGFYTVDGVLYYFDEDLKMLRSTSVGLYRIDENGACQKVKIVDGSNVKYKADEIIAEVGSSASALCNYVHTHVSYYFINEPMVYANPYAADWASIAAFAANRGYGACYHYSAFLHVLLQRAGYTSRIVVGTGFYPSLHSYNQVLADGQWVTYDAYYNYQATTTAYMQSLGYTYDHFVNYSYD